MPTNSLVSDEPKASEHIDPELAQYYAEQYVKTGSQHYKTLVVRGFTKMVSRCAAPFTNLPDVERNDLLSEGFMGLLKALEDYNPDKARFSTIAMYEIRGAIQHFIRDRRTTIRVPAWVTDFYRKETKAIAALELALGRTPIQQEVAQEIGVSLERYLYVKRTNPHVSYRSYEELLAESDPSGGEERHAHIPRSSMSLLNGHCVDSTICCAEDYTFLKGLGILAISRHLGVSFNEAESIHSQINDGT